MMILKTARRVAVVAVAGAATIALSACSAGQITQTSDQVAAVDGAGAETADKSVAARDVTIIISDDQSAAVKFTAINQDPAMKTHKISSVTVGGKEAKLSEKAEIKPKCNVVADSKANIELMKKNDDLCITYIDTEITNDGFAVGGQKPVVLKFDSGEIKVNATIATNHNEDNTGNRVEAPKGH